MNENFFISIMVVIITGFYEVFYRISSLEESDTIQAVLYTVMNTLWIDLITSGL